MLIKCKKRVNSQTIQEEVYFWEKCSFQENVNKCVKKFDKQIKMLKK